VTDRILVAGIGNIFLGDDAFGVEVVRALFMRVRTPGVRVVDFGIRSLDLAYALLDPWELVVLVDAVARGEAPGTLFTIQPDLASIHEGARAGIAVDAHTMDPVKVLQLAASMGEIPGRILVLGCEPGDCGGEEGRMGLTPPVTASIPGAVRMLDDLLQVYGNNEAASSEIPFHEVRG
jgi:hydrogenase maturation protease